MSTTQKILLLTGRSRWAKYLLAAGLTLLMLMARVGFGQRFESPMLIVFIIPIILSAYSGGLGPGLLATAISVLGADYFLLAPLHSFNVLSATNRVQEVVLLLTGILVSGICEMFRCEHARVEILLTARKQDEAQKAQLAAIVESSDDAIVGKNLDGIVTSWNAGAEKIFGYTAQEMVGQPILRLIPPERQHEEAEILACVRRGESIRHFDTVRLRKDGSRIDISVTTSAIKDAAGKIIGASKVARDITERVQMAIAARASEERFQTMANSMLQLAWIARADGFIFWYNERWYEYTGTTPAQMEGWGWQNVHDPKVLPTVMENWKKAIEAGKPFEMEFPLRRADGQFRAFLTRSQPLRDSEGRVVQWFGTNTDVEALKQAEAAVQRLNAELEQRVIERTAQLEMANKELEAVSYSVSHDLRAPLRAVNGFAGIVLERFGTQIPAGAQGYLERIRNGGKQMGLLIDDLLAFSHMSRQTMSPKMVDMDGLVKNVLTTLISECPDRPIEIKAAPLPVCQGDVALIKQVWVNLISNALKYTRGRVPALIEIGCVSGDGPDVYFVRDNGTGFDMKYAHKLFGVFQRLHRAEDFEGTGVGLAIVQRVVQRHGGRVWAEAEEGRGAIFRFTLTKET